MNFIVSHIYKQGNTCANGLANIGLNLSETILTPSVPRHVTPMIPKS
jgi:hypothetical protein